jgi:hypothetical protein
MKTVKSEHRSGQQCISQTKENICCVFVDDSTEEKEFMHVAANVDNDDGQFVDFVLSCK